MKERTHWHSSRLDQEVQVVRWGVIGMPVLIFPTAGGDAEEIERFHIIDSVSELLAAGRIKVYSCDSVAGRILLAGEGDAAYRMAMQNRFHTFVYHELVPAIRADCQDDSIGVISAGSSIGAFNALAVLCRYPDAFVSALCLSGTFDLRRFHKAQPNHDFFFSSPLHFIPHLGGSQLDLVRKRFVLIATGEGDQEDVGESWQVANLLGRHDIPNRIDSWGPDWHHDWVTWREMFPTYLDELTRRHAAELAAPDLSDSGS